MASTRGIRLDWMVFSAPIVVHSIPGVATPSSLQLLFCNLDLHEFYYCTSNLEPCERKECIQNKKSFLFSQRAKYALESQAEKISPLKCNLNRLTGNL